MNKLKKCIVIFLSVLIIGSMIYLIATDDIMLLNPKMIVSNYQTCQKTVSITEIYRGAESDILCVNS